MSVKFPSTEEKVGTLNDSNQNTTSTSVRFPEQTTRESDSSLSVKKGLIGTGLAVGGGLGLKWFTQPAFDLYGVNKESNKLKKEVGIHPKVGLGELEKQVGYKQQLSIAPIKDKISIAEATTKRAVLNAKNQLSQFDNAILTTNIDDTAQFIKAGHRDFLNTGYNNYGAGLTASAELLKDVGINGIDVETYLLKVIEPVIENARSAGIPDDKLNYLLNIKKQLAIKFDSKGVEIKTKPLSLQQAKGYIDNVDNFRFKNSLTDKFGKLLEDLAPEGSIVKGQIQKMNTSYKPFKEMNTAMYKVIKQTTGEFDDAALTGWLKSYIKTAKDTSKENVLRLLSEGNENINPIPGLKSQVENLKSLRVQRQQLTQQPLQIKTQSQAQIQALKAELQREIKKYVLLKQKASEIASKGKVAKGKLIGRAITAGALSGQAGNIVQNFLRLPFSGKVTTALPAIGVAGMALQAGDALSELLKGEPIRAFQSFVGGKQVPLLERTKQINRELTNNPRAYSNAIFTPETANFLAMREKALRAKDRNYKSKIIEVFKKRGIIPAIQQLLSETSTR